MMKMTILTNDDLKMLFDELDQKHFDGELKCWRIVFARLEAKILGVANWDRVEIEIHEGLKENPVELRRTVLHEMVHAKLFRAGDPSHQRRNNGHGLAFRREIVRLIEAGEDMGREIIIRCAGVGHKKIKDAAERYLRRQAGTEKPDGFWMNWRWYPSKAEECGCCESIRSPSRRWPKTHFDHCKTVTHVAMLEGVDTVLLRYKLKQIEEKRGVRP